MILILWNQPIFDVGFDDRYDIVDIDIKPLADTGTEILNHDSNYIEAELSSIVLRILKRKHFFFFLLLELFVCVA